MLALLLAGLQPSVAQFVPTQTFSGTPGDNVSLYAQSGITWTKHSSYTGNANITTALRARCSSTDTDTVYYASGTPGSADYRVQATFHTANASLSGPNGIYLLLTARQSTSVRTNYEAGWNADNAWWYVQSTKAGVQTVLAHTSTLTPTANHDYTIKFTVTGSSPVSLKFNVDGTDVITTSDSSSPITAAGVAGFHMYQLSDDTLGWTLDNFMATTSLSTAAPSFTPSSSYSDAAVSLSMSTTTGGASIYYTLDGSAPTTSSTLYSAPITINPSPSGTTVKALADLSGDPSAVTTGVVKKNRAYPGAALYAKAQGGSGLDGPTHLVTSGCLFKDPASGVWYWFGENRFGVSTTAGFQDALPIGCYSSTDMVNWTFQGNILAGISSRVLERCKILYAPQNDAAHRYVLWCHYDDSGYSLGHVRVAYNSSPTGTWTWNGADFLPDGIDSRDMTVYKDGANSSSATAYLFFSASGNAALKIATLSADYLSVVASSTVIAGVGAREAPAVIKVGATYYLLTSGLTGWSQNENRYATSSTVNGPYADVGNPFVASGSEDNSLAFHSQTTQTVDTGTGELYYYGERYDSTNHANDTHVILPLKISGGVMTITWPGSTGEWSLFPKRNRRTSGTRAGSRGG